MIAPIKLMTVEEFEQIIALPENSDRLLELIHGEMVQKMPTEEHGEIARLLGAVLGDFIIPRKLGRVGVEVSHRMPDDAHNERLPDVSFTAGKRPRVTTGSVLQMPDFAIEIKSPTDSLKVMREKATYYLTNGTRLVWIVDPAKHLVIVLTADDEQILLEAETLTGGDVLPGFTLPVHAIFVDPLADDGE